MSEPSTPTGFDGLGLDESLLVRITGLGFSTPTPIQAAAIPVMLAGQDLIGQAQTGSGKTAAFGLPLVQNLDLSRPQVQALILAPTRELAGQVAEAVASFAGNRRHIACIYGGADYARQVRQVRQGAQIVVGTPGRIMDHMRRGSLDLSALSHLILDEADEMLRMGFIDDVEWVLSQLPPERQISLFSATLPPAIRRIAEGHLHDPIHLAIQQRIGAAETIRQRYAMLGGLQKLDALTRILEAGDHDAALCFVRTKAETCELADRLRERGFRSTALNGDMAQGLRERCIDAVKQGTIDILVATDVAARGLDLDRISLVVNYDAPFDCESYVHRIGRTGRAGRCGEAILFLHPRETRLLRELNRVTGQRIELMHMPSAEEVNRRRIERFHRRLAEAIDGLGDNPFTAIISDFCNEHGTDSLQAAAALAQLYQGNEPFLLSHDLPHRHATQVDRNDFAQRKAGRKTRGPEMTGAGMQRYHIGVGRSHGVQARHIVGAIANESGITGKDIGRISLHHNFSTVELPDWLPAAAIATLAKSWVVGRQMRLRRWVDNQNS